MLGVVLTSCVEKQAGSGNAYFSLKDYFNAQAAQLQQSSPLISKRVVVNGLSEEKRLKIADWKTELSTFIDADINKAAWSGAFRVQKTDTSERYTSSDPKIPVRKVEIMKKAGEVSRITIVSVNENYLYRSSDSLTYLPGSYYRIDKKQHIRLLNPKSYQVTGTFAE
ncbi:hypothetical protein [Pedobacter sp. SYP-B3415]|uniref:hypothetical protein n=1 Tax=Pedobacter sp. SYP-B3415 TaxID=2496641 RepID=UPI00101D276B|nr:hypothetical protein [Pedobacter sp. SYP-B3415]